MYPTSSKSLVLAATLGFNCFRTLVFDRILNSCNSIALAFETLTRTGSWTVFSGCGLPSLGHSGMPSVPGAGEGAWIQGTVGWGESWLLKLLPVSGRREYHLSSNYCVPGITFRCKMSLSNSLWNGGMIITNEKADTEGQLLEVKQLVRLKARTQLQFCLTPNPCPLPRTTLSSELRDSALNWWCDFGQVSLPLWASVSPSDKVRCVISVFPAVSILNLLWFLRPWKSSDLCSFLCTRKNLPEKGTPLVLVKSSTLLISSFGELLYDRHRHRKIFLGWKTILTRE